MLTIAGAAKRYGDVNVFRHVSLQVAAGEFVALVGESGVGKSTLLNAIAGLDTLDEGRVVLDGCDVGTLDEPARARWRRRELGFVFQAFHVLPHLNVADNVALPLWLSHRDEPERVQAVLDALELGALAARMPAQLSGGQLQRVAIARALVHGPKLILADEPTGNLDPRTAALVMQQFAEQVTRSGAACLMVTHSVAAASHTHRVLVLTDTGITEPEQAR